MKRTRRDLIDMETKSAKEEMNLKELVKEYYPETPPVDRVGDWDKFAKEMHDYIEKFTVQKYGSEEMSGFDLMTVTEPRESIWNILKLSLRLWNRKGKKWDWYKIAHYCQMGWTKGKGNWKELHIEEDHMKTG
jgi:hypothetical protein